MLASQRISNGTRVECRRACRPMTHRTFVTTRAAATTRAPSLQLATAKLPPGVVVSAFAQNLYNWAATLTQSGANYPFALPIQADKLPTGFKISLLKSVAPGSFASAGDIEATVEEIPQEGNVLFVRFFEGPASMADRKAGAPPQDPEQRLEVVLRGLVDVGTIMGTMPGAIRSAVQRSKQ